MRDSRKIITRFGIQSSHPRGAVNSARVNLGAPRRETNDPTDFSVGGESDFALHRTQPKELAPAEFISVERMILHYGHRVGANHCLHGDKLGGGLPRWRDGLHSAESRPP